MIIGSSSGKVLILSTKYSLWYLSSLELARELFLIQVKGRFFGTSRGWCNKDALLWCEMYRWTLRISMNLFIEFTLVMVS